MSQGTLFCTDQSRTLLLQGLIKNYDLDIEIKPYHCAEHLENFPLGKVPAYIAKDGFKLQEAIAVILYVISLIEEKTGEKSKLMGESIREYCSIIKWMSFGTSDFLFNFAPLKYAITGMAPYDEKTFKEGMAKLEAQIAFVENSLVETGFLIGNKLTLADLFVACCFNRTFCILVDKSWTNKHPILMKWWYTAVKDPLLDWFFKDFQFRDKPLEPQPPKY